MSRGRSAALTVIETEIEYFAEHVGEAHASDGASSSIELAFLVGQIDAAEQARYKTQVLRIYKHHRESAA